MNVIINDQIIELANQITVSELFTVLKRKTLGAAVAINKVIITKSQWETYLVNDKDEILIFQIVAGG
ncbi:Sulfur carrier protein ThiS [Candidatus Providencia siddallii]|uniref:Sulfur carrier protein ThiS n=1 Tax=Candidatus Providencia siddallii TaxID=1715285 RepID=A0A0M6W950_9GAMM|nr:Sulfur carrier protein ThiS [Candidatus Providencia siddallii]